jgi:ABC-type glycerol-3-phosphate transport system substrate-binding protein
LLPELFGWQSTFDNYGLPRDPITLTVNINIAQLRHAGTLGNIGDFMLRDATGITLDYRGTDEETFAVMVAGGDLPDIITMDSSNNRLIGDLIASGRLVEMESYLERFGQNLNPVLEGTTYNWVKYWTSEWAGEDGIYFLPNQVVNIGDTVITNTLGDGTGFNIRLDIYEAIGAPPIVDSNGFNEDMFLDVLLQMQNYARDEMGIANAYALTGFTEWGWDYHVNFMYHRSVTGQLQPNFYHDTSTLEFLPAFHDPSHYRWDAYRFFNKAYRMGIYDPESFILHFGDFWDRVANSAILTVPFSWMFDYAPEPLPTDYPQVGAFIIKGIPYLHEVKMNNNPLGMQIDGARGINADSPHAERIVALFDYAASDEFMRDCDRAQALYGVHWEYNSGGYPVFINERLDHANNVPGASDLFGHGLKFDYGMYYQIAGVTEKIHADGFPTRFEMAEFYIDRHAVVTQPMQLFFDLMEAGSEVKIPGHLYLQWINEGIMRTNPPFQADFKFAPAAPDDLAGIALRIESFIEDNESRLVMAPTEEAFEEALASVLAQILAMGEDRVYADHIERLRISQQIAQNIVGN